MNPYQIILISIGGVFMLAGLLLIGIFVVFVAFPKLTVKVTANQTWSKRYKNVRVREFGNYKYVNMTKCHYVYQTRKKSYRFKIDFYRKTQRQSPLRVSVRYIKAFPRIFCVNHPQELGAGIYLFFGICFVIMAIALCSIGFSTT